MTDYYKILGVTSNATIEQIKKAYRSKAKLYHPDINKKEDAHEKFLLITEAYEYLTQYKQRKANANREQQVEDLNQFWRQWQEQKRKEARERAREHARMKYEAYLKSDLYRTTEVADSVVEFLITLFVLSFLIGLPLLIYSKYGLGMIWIALILALPTAPIWFKFLLRTFNKKNLFSFVGLSQSSIQVKVTRFIILAMVNVVLFFGVVLKALISLNWIFTIYALCIGLGYIASMKMKSKYHKYLIRWVAAPAVVSIFFTINRCATNLPYQESYWYTFDLSDHRDTFSTIQLENNHYQKYPGIRFFINLQPIMHNSKITYTFATGVFGIKVVKDREINP